MLEENTHNKQSLLSSVKSGPHLVTISKIEKFTNNLGESIKHKGHEGIVITFKSEDISHQELYWKAGYRYVKLLKLLKVLNVSPENITAKNVIGKKLWIAIRHNVTIEGDKEIKREVEIVEYSPEDKKPNVPSLYEEYDIMATN